MKKKTWRIVSGTALGLVALVAIGLFGCLDAVDYRPYFRQSYYTATMAGLRVRLATNSIVQGELSAGFGSARLTPALNSWPEDPRGGRFRSLTLAGYGDRKGRPATGAHDDLYVKAVAIRVADRLGIMIGADSLIMPREVADMAAQRLGQELGLKRDQLYLSATHTHCGIGGWGEGKVGEAFAGKFQPGARTWLAECVMKATREAVGDLKPASFGHGSFAAPQYVRNRLVGTLGKVDPEFSYAIFKQRDGRITVMGSYAAHATVLSGAMMEYSADYPGYWQRAVEQATGGMAMFLAGGVGSHGPAAGEGGLHGAQSMGEALARMCVEKLAHTITTNRISFGILGLEVALPPFNVRISDGMRLRPWIAERLLPKRASFLQTFRLADSLWISTPCDFSGELALGIKDYTHGLRADAIVTSFNGDYVGYVILPRYYHLSGYEPRLMSFYGPYVPDYFDELIRTMATAMARE